MPTEVKPYFSEYGDPNWSRLTKLIGKILLGVFLLVTLFSSFTTVQAGTVKEVLRFGNPIGRTLYPGFHWLIPYVDGTQTLTTRKMIYETTAEDKQKGSQADYKDFPVDTNTKDGQQVDVYYTVRFAVDPTQAKWIVENIGSEVGLVEKIVKTESRIWARNVPRNFEAEGLYQGQGTEEVQNEIFARLEPTFKSNGLVLDSVGIREIKFKDDYITAIERKQIEQVNVTTEEYKANQAEKRKAATIADAQAQAEAQRLQSQTLTADVLQKIELENKRLEAEAMKISADKGQKIVPDYVINLDGQTTPLLQLPTATKK